MNRVVISSYGAVTPIGIGSDFENIFKSQVSGIVQVPNEFYNNVPEEKRATLVNLLKVNAYAPVKEDIEKLIEGYIGSCSYAKEMGRCLKSQLERYHNLSFLSAAVAGEKIPKGALELNESATNAGIYFGSGIGGLQSFQDGTAKIFSEGKRPNPFFIPDSIVNILTPINVYFGIKGPTDVTSTACASGLHAILSAYENLASGIKQLDWAIAGGADAPLTVNAAAGFGTMRALSKRNANDNPSRPFDKDRDGFVLGEGAVSVILATEQFAKKKGLPIIAEIISGFATQDCQIELVMPHPEGQGLYDSMRRALELGNVSAEQVDLIVAHGTSTPAGDKAEIKGIRKLFGNTKIPKVTSNKGVLGHTIGASGPANLVTAIVGMQYGFIQGTNYLVKDPEFEDINIVKKEGSSDNTIVHALVNSAGFGGQNCSILLKRYYG